MALLKRLFFFTCVTDPTSTAVDYFRENRKCGTNRPFPSSKKSHFQSEAKREAIDMKIIFNYDANKTHFHNKGLALSLVLKVRFFGTRKWPLVKFMKTTSGTGVVHLP